MIPKNIHWMMLGYMLSSIISRIGAKSYETILYPIGIAILLVLILILRRGEK